MCTAVGAPCSGSRGRICASRPGAPAMVRVRRGASLSRLSRHEHSSAIGTGTVRSLPLTRRGKRELERQISPWRAHMGVHTCVRGGLTVTEPYAETCGREKGAGERATLCTSAAAEWRCVYCAGGRGGDAGAEEAGKKQADWGRALPTWLVVTLEYGSMATNSLQLAPLSLVRMETMCSPGDPGTKTRACLNSISIA